MKGAKEFYSVLLADDSEDDRLFTRLAFRNHPTLRIVEEVTNGEEAIAYLSGTGVYIDRVRYPFPDLLLLDLKMPRFDGFEVLVWLQGQRFTDLKVVVVSGSFLPADIARTLELGADLYHIKAASRVEQEQLVQGLGALLGICYSTI